MFTSLKDSNNTNGDETGSQKGGNKRKDPRIQVTVSEQFFCGFDCFI